MAQYKRIWAEEVRDKLERKVLIKKKYKFNELVKCSIFDNFI